MMLRQADVMLQSVSNTGWQKPAERRELSLLATSVDGAERQRRVRHFVAGATGLMT